MIKSILNFFKRKKPTQDFVITPPPWVDSMSIHCVSDKESNKHTITIVSYGIGGSASGKGFGGGSGGIDSTREPIYMSGGSAGSKASLVTNINNESS